MEGMISKDIIPTWTQGLVTKLLKATHGQWLYRNIHVHEATAGIKATARNEEIQRFVEDQIKLGEDGLVA